MGIITDPAVGVVSVVKDMLAVGAIVMCPQRLGENILSYFAHQLLPRHMLATLIQTQSVRFAVQQCFSTSHLMGDEYFLMN